MFTGRNAHSGGGTTQMCDKWKTDTVLIEEGNLPPSVIPATGHSAG